MKGNNNWVIGPQRLRQAIAARQIVTLGRGTGLV
jgi:hypothetical protein